MYNIFQEFDVSLINDELLGFSVTCKLPSDHPFAPAATITLANHECWWDKFYIPCRELPYQWNRKVYLPNCLRRYYLGLSGNHPSFLLSSGFLWISFFRKFVQLFNCSVSARCQGHQGCWMHVGFRCNEVILQNRWSWSLVVCRWWLCGQKRGRNCVACVAQACEFSIPVVSSEPLKETKLRGWGNCSGRRSFVKYHDSPDCFAA